MVNYQLNANIKNAMEVMFKECDIAEDRITELKSYIPKEEIENEIYPIPHRIIKEISDNLLKKYPDEDGNKYRFNSLIKSSKMILLSPKPRVKSPELLKILENIKREQENKEYLKLTKDTFGDKEEEEGFGAIANVAKKQITLIFNFGLSIAAGFTAGYVLGGQMSSDVGKRVLLGFLVATIIGVAEGWFMMKDFLLLEKNEDNMEEMYAKMQLDPPIEKMGGPEMPVIPQIKNSKKIQKKDNKKTV